MADFGSGVERLLLNKPADFYIYGHFGSHEAEVQQIEQLGIPVYRYMNTHDVREAARDWEPEYEWGRIMIDAIDTYGLALTRDGDPSGPQLHFRWFGNGLVLRWDRVPPGSAAMEFLLAGRGFLANHPGPFFVDQAWTRIYEWMLLEGVSSRPDSGITQEVLDTLYDPADYEANYLEFLRRLEQGPNGEGQDRLVVVNGQRNWDTQYGRLMMYENSNLDDFYQWPDVLQRWRNTPGTMLELNDRQPGEAAALWERAVEAVDVWLQTGGLLVGNESDVPAYALAMRRTACVDSSIGVVDLGNFQETAVDTTANDRADYLSVGLEVVTTGDALLLGSGELYDASGRFVAGGYGQVAALRGIPVFLELRFDGRMIFGNLRNGPYAIRNVHINWEGADPGLVIPDVGSTRAYGYREFEPAAVITGTVEAALRLPAVGAEVSSPWAVDFVDAEGRYRLIYLQDRTILVRAHYESIAGWHIVLDDIAIGEGDSALVTVAVGRVDRLDFRFRKPTDTPDPDRTDNSPKETVLFQNVPNPSPALTEIPFLVSRPGPVRLTIYDAAGRRVRTLLDTWVPEGSTRVMWDGTGDDGRAEGSGVYFYELVTPDGPRTRRITLVR